MIASSSSSPNTAYTETAIKALMATFVKEHDSSIAKATKAIDASTSSCQQATTAIEESTKSCKQATENVQKLISDAHVLLDSL